MEKRSFTMQDFWSALRALQGESKAHDDKPITVKEYSKMYCLLCKVRLDTWRALANDLPGNRVSMLRGLLDYHELNVLFAALDDDVNEDNPLYRWFELRRTGRRPVGKETEEPDLGLIKNAGFEAGLEGWGKNYDDARRLVEFDKTVTREGLQSLRVISAQPSDTGFSQRVMLKPGQWYRFSGWVRTRGLHSHASSVYGTYAIQGMGGYPFAKGANHGGDTEWTEVPITFQAPADGLVHIAVCFACWGQGTGTAWFDDLKLVEVSKPP
jgi:hypothetical protein